MSATTNCTCPTLNNRKVHLKGCPFKPVIVR